MDYKAIILKLLKKFPELKWWEMIKLNRYFLEYARLLAEKVGIDTIKEYKRTSKLINIYNSRDYTCFWDVRVILDTYSKIAETQTQYQDSETIIYSIATKEEVDQVKCFIELLDAIKISA